jgi:hypothetical protein
MPRPSILVATWGNGLFSVTGKTVRQELPDRSVRSPVPDGRGGALAIVGGHSLCRRSPDGEWTEIVKSEFDLSCCVPIGNVVFAGTDDANVLRVEPDGAQQRLTGFDAVEGRDKCMQDRRSSTASGWGRRWGFVPWRRHAMVPCF